MKNLLYYKKFEAKDLYAVIQLIELKIGVYF